MDKRQLSYFLKIIELGSYRRAATALRIAQPALSRQVKRLEESLGVTLFFREGRGIRPTEAGELLRERASFILRQFEQAELDVIARGTVPRGEVNFGAPTSVGELLYPRIVTRYLKLYPDVRIRLFEGIGHLWDWLGSGEIDLAILPDSESYRGSNFVTQTLAEERLYLVGPPGDRTMPAEAATIAEIMTRPLIISGHPNTARRRLEREATRQGMQLRIAVETGNLSIQSQLVENGLGYAVLPYSAAQRLLDRSAFAVRAVEGLTLYRTLARHAERPLTPAVAKMIEFIAAEAAVLAAEGRFGPVNETPRSAVAGVSGRAG